MHEIDRCLSVLPAQPPQSAPACVSGLDPDATTSTATGPRVAGDVVRSRRPQRRGPKTVAGKARIALNALTHGIASTRLVVPGERREAWAAHCQRVLDALAPVGPVEAALAERVAAALWRLHRVTAYEEAAIVERQDLETVSARLLPHPLDIDKIIRYEAHLSRQLYQALHEHEAMRAGQRGQAAPLVRVDVHGAPDLIATAGTLTDERHRGRPQSWHRCAGSGSRWLAGSPRPAGGAPCVCPAAAPPSP